MKKIDSTMKKEYYNSALPHGYRVKVAALAGVKVQAVSDFLHGRNNSIRIENAILTTLAQIRKEQTKREKLFKEAGIELV